MERLGYPAQFLDKLPASAVESFAGVGHHLDLDPPRKGESVLDLGCGSGSDVFHAALQVQQPGRSIGIDMTDAMLDKARAAAAAARVTGVEFVKGHIEDLPFGASSFDCVLSNGVINLAVDKASIGRRGVKLSCANIALTRAQIAFAEQARYREEAVQDIAHDLRTPLTSIKGAAQNVLDGIAGPANGRVLAYVDIIKHQSIRLIGVVNWLLQAIRITSEPRALETAATDVGSLVQQVVDGLRPIARERGVELRASPATAPGWVDPSKLQQVLDNVIGNALKFTDRGGRVDVMLQTEPDLLQITVSDTGIGMDEEALKRIFHRYYRAHPEREGSGLGLLISREMVRLHGGDIRVESELGKGSRVTITLPREGVERRSTSMSSRT